MPRLSAELPDLRPALHVQESAPEFRIAGKPFHKGGTAVPAAVSAARMEVDQTAVYRKAGSGYDIFVCTSRI